MPFSSIALVTISGGEPKLNPICSKKSALPQLPVVDLFPCFATFAPPADATIAAAVLMLNDLIASPPVPQLSIKQPLILGVICMANFLIACKISQISSEVSPFIVRATRNDAIDASDNLP